MTIIARTPNRIDLAGGTLDIYPLYVFLKGGYTLNAAIDLYSEVELEPLPQDGFILVSEDLNEYLEISREDLFSGAEDDSAFRLLIAALRHYKPAGGLKVTSRNQAPKGSGLGASSALMIALSGALNHYQSLYLDGEHLIRTAADLEAWVIDIPTGKQDYYAALYGGIQSLHFDAGGIEREPFALSDKFMEELNTGLVLSFTGQSHFSGTNNWNMTKRYIDNSGDTRSALQSIKKTSEALREALMTENIEWVYDLLNQEWDNRKSLAEGVSNRQIENMLEAAHLAGAKASKICGAGGGGCLLTLCHPGDKLAV